MNITIGQKLGAVVALLAVVAAGLAGFAFHQSVLEEKRAAATDAAWDLALRARGLEHALEHVAVAADSVFTSDDKQEAQTKLFALESAVSEAQRAAKGFLSHVGTRLPDARKTRLALRIKEFLAYQNDTAQLGLTISPRAALIQAQDEATVKNRDQMIADIDSFGRMLSARLAAERAEIAQGRQQARLLLAIPPALVILGAVLTSIWIVKVHIEWPLARLIAATRALAGGRLATEVPSVAQHDEIGEMARAIAAFKAAAVENLRLEREAAEQRELTADLRQRNEADRVETARKQDQVLSSLALALEKLSSGDVSFRLNEPFAADYEKLRGDYNKAIQQLQTMLTHVAVNARTILDKMDEAKNAARHLSQRTEKQAAGLEETSTALDEISATLHKSAASTTHAREAVFGARQHAEDGGTVAKQALAAMSEIETSSKEIGKITGVIDEIALQTNLLALNAGVEAARSGEAGKGFAVIASEVRALAQRAAEAAKEIRGLINQAKAHVDQGVTLVARTSDALTLIVGEAAQAGTLVAEIAERSKDQAIGLNSITAAISHIDQLTQQNAAMVEETTVANETLTDETRDLVRLIARFKLGTVALRKAA